MAFSLPRKNRYMISLALRFDDSSATSNHALESAIFEAAQRHRQPITVAAIPYRQKGDARVPLSSANSGHLLDAHRCGVIEIALHGYSHEPSGVTPAGKPTEFWGTPRAQQLQRIRDGQHVLEEMFGSKIRGFVPPWNTSDAATLSALNDLGFAYISGEESIPARLVGLMSLPRTCQMVDLRRVVTAARPFAWMYPILIAVVHHYDFIESGSELARTSLNDFAALLEWVADQPYLRRSTLAELALEKRGALGQLHTLTRFLPSRFRHFVPRDCLVSVPQLLSFLH